MAKYRVIIAYDGLPYHGWQRQADQITVSGTLEQAFKDVFHVKAQVLGASRTDAGVHALGQVAVINTPLDLLPEVIRKNWNLRLPRDIHIRDMQRAATDFHPLKNVLQKTYLYHFSIARPLPFIARYCVRAPDNINIVTMHEALAIFKGQHDFRSFCTGDEQESTIRTIDDIYMTYLKKLNIYRITIKGKSFLRYMIRRIVGACFDVSASKHRSIDELKKALEEKNPQQELANAKPHGLLLRRIIYKENEHEQNI